MYTLVGSIDEDKVLILPTLSQYPLYQGEDNSAIFDLTILAEFKDFEYHVDILAYGKNLYRTPDPGIKPVLNNTDSKYHVTFSLPAPALASYGDVRMQLSFSLDDVTYMTSVVNLEVKASLNPDGIDPSAMLPLNSDKFISLVRTLVLTVKTDGGGDMFLSNDGTYKVVPGSSGELENYYNKTEVDTKLSGLRVDAGRY